VDARRRDASHADARLSKRHLDRHDSDGRARIDRARVSNKAGAAGARLRQAHERLGKAREREAATSVGARYETGIAMTSTACPRDVLAWLPEGALALGPSRPLAHPVLAVRRGDRIGVSGANGSGKSTLLRALLGGASLPDERLVVLPQELPEEEESALLREVRALPGARLGDVMNLLSRMGSRPQQLLESAVPSPGEARKLLLALGLERRAWLVVADEPTNHLDLPSIEALEEALAAWDGALLMASHDERFLEALTTSRWALAADGEGSHLE
jgi:ATPase subunit of ABC transporter with duplicated ATPase domains